MRYVVLAWRTLRDRVKRCYGVYEDVKDAELTAENLARYQPEVRAVTPELLEGLPKSEAQYLERWLE